MILGFLLDPTVFDPSRFEKGGGYADQIDTFFEDLFQNGVVIVDHDAYLLDIVEECVDRLPELHRQSILVLMDELRMTSQSGDVCRFVPLLDVSIPENIAELNAPNFFAAIFSSDTVEVDTLVAGDETAIALEDSLPQFSCKVTPMETYRKSEIHLRSVEYRKSFSPDKLQSKTKVSNQLGPCFRYAQRFVLVDPSFLKTGDSRSGTTCYKESLKYLLQLVRNNNCYRDSCIEIELYAIEPERVDVESEMESILDGKRKRNSNAVSRFDEKVLNPLRTNFSKWRFSLIVKSEPDSDMRAMHARYIFCKHAILRFDKGFQLFNRNKKFVRNPISHVPEEFYQLSDFTALPNSECSPAIQHKTALEEAQ